jgi:hypothetical protein
MKISGTHTPTARTLVGFTYRNDGQRPVQYRMSGYPEIKRLLHQTNNIFIEDLQIKITKSSNYSRDIKIGILDFLGMMSEPSEEGGTIRAHSEHQLRTGTEFMLIPCNIRKKGLLNVIHHKRRNQAQRVSEDKTQRYLENDFPRIYSAPKTIEGSYAANDTHNSIIY